MDEQAAAQHVGVGVSLALTLISGVSTGIGGLIAALLGSPDERVVGQMEAFSGGVMLYLSLFDLMPESIPVVGLSMALAGLMCGGALFWLIAQLVPDPSQPLSNALVSYLSRMSDPASTLSSSQSMITTPERWETSPALHQKAAVLTRRTASAVSDGDKEDAERGMDARPQDQLLPQEVGNSSSTDASGGETPSHDSDRGDLVNAPIDACHDATIGVQGSSGTSTVIDEKGEKQQREYRRAQFMRTALVTTLGICIHNFPEGVALYLSTLKGLRFGAALAVTISLHNIPEGLAVAVPIAYTTKSKLWTIMIPFITGLFEPLGAIVAGLFLHSLITDEWLHFLLAMVAGVMTFISINELFPVAIKHCGAYASIVSAAVGMLVCQAFMSASYLLE